MGVGFGLLFGNGGFFVAETEPVIAVFCVASGEKSAGYAQGGCAMDEPGCG